MDPRADLDLLQREESLAPSQDTNRPLPALSQSLHWMTYSAPCREIHRKYSHTKNFICRWLILHVFFVFPCFSLRSSKGGNYFSLFHGAECGGEGGGRRVSRVNSPPFTSFPLLLHLCLFIVFPSVTALLFKPAPMSQSKYDCFPPHTNAPSTDYEPMLTLKGGMHSAKFWNFSSTGFLY